jgi:site-specific DNA-methyltransferase (adenine-specific)
MGCEELGEQERVRQDLAGEHKNTFSKNFHPTVKPIALMEYLVKLVSREGAIVLDPFTGSGSTGIACKKLNRQFIGIEREADYVKIANARINASPDKIR